MASDLAREALAPEGVLPLRVNEMTPSVIICAEGSRISIQWREQRPGQPDHDEYGRAEAMAAFLVEAANRYSTAYDAIGSGVKVRALEWDEHGSAKALGLRYEVWLHRDVADGYKERWLAAQINGATDRLGGFDSRDEAKAAAQADFERRVLSCLSPVAVEEADAKAGEPDHECIPGPMGPERCVSCGKRFRPLAAPSTPSPQIGEAGAGPVGEAVAWGCWNEDGNALWSVALQKSKQNQTPLYARPVEEPGEVAHASAERSASEVFAPLPGLVERITRERDEARALEAHETAVREEACRRADAAEAALAETRERLENAAQDERNRLLDAAYSSGIRGFLRRQGAVPLQARAARAALTGDAQEVGR